MSKILWSFHSNYTMMFINEKCLRCSFLKLTSAVSIRIWACAQLDYSCCPLDGHLAAEILSKMLMDEMKQIFCNVMGPPPYSQGLQDAETLVVSCLASLYSFHLILVSSPTFSCCSIYFQFHAAPFLTPWMSWWSSIGKRDRCGSPYSTPATLVQGAVEPRTAGR